MSHLISPRAMALAGLAAFAVTLAGCGKTGELQRPAPMFGARNGKTPPAAENGPTGQDPTRPVSTYDPRNQFDVNPAPARVDEIPGQAPDPTQPGPQGSLPDPYANPR